MIQLLAALSAFPLSALFGQLLLPVLRALKAGQSIREIGPKWHAGKAGTPTMGGLSFIAAAFCVVLAFGWKDMLEGHCEHLYAFGFALVYGIIGFLDDFMKVKYHRNLGLTAMQKLLLQVAAAGGYLAILRATGSLSGELYVPFAQISLPVNGIVYTLFALFVIVGGVNAVNLTDGVDGLATGVTIPVMATFALTAYLWGQRTLGLVPSAMVGALAGFLLHNRHPAKMFMGDTGSLFLGGLVSGLAFALDMPLALLLAGVIYIVETLSVIMQVTYFKLTHGKRIFKMTPIHHHFEMLGWSEGKIVLVFTAVTVVACVIAWLGVRGRT